MQENERVLRSIGEESIDLTRALNVWRTRIALALGETAEAHHWMQEMALEADLTSQSNSILEDCYLLQARLFLNHARWQEADRLLQWLCASAERQKRRGSLVSVDVLESLLYLPGTGGAGTGACHAVRSHGDRMAGVKDPFGNHWYLATPLADGS